MFTPSYLSTILVFFYIVSTAAASMTSAPQDILFLTLFYVLLPIVVCLFLWSFIVNIFSDDVRVKPSRYLVVDLESGCATFRRHMRTRSF
jgi:hypothetical protein